MLSILMTSLALQEAPAPGQAAPDAVPVPAVAPAEVPAPRVAVHREPLEAYSEQGYAAGHTGSAVVETTLSPDGTTTDSVVVESSRSPLLDADALTVIADRLSFQPPAEPFRVQFTIEFPPRDFLNMRCDAFARQVRWRQSVWPERSIEDTKLYEGSLGYFAMALFRRTSDPRAVRLLADEMKLAFANAVPECERQPDRLYLEVLASVMTRRS